MVDRSAFARRKIVPDHLDHLDHLDHPVHPLGATGQGTVAPTVRSSAVTGGVGAESLVLESPGIANIASRERVGTRAVVTHCDGSPHAETAHHLGFLATVGPSLPKNLVTRAVALVASTRMTVTSVAKGSRMSPSLVVTGARTTRIFVRHVVFVDTKTISKTSACVPSSQPRRRFPTTTTKIAKLTGHAEPR